MKRKSKNSRSVKVTILVQTFHFFFNWKYYFLHFLNSGAPPPRGSDVGNTYKRITDTASFTQFPVAAAALPAKEHRSPCRPMLASRGHDCVWASRSRGRFPCEQKANAGRACQSPTSHRTKYNGLKRRRGEGNTHIIRGRRPNLAYVSLPLNANHSPLRYCVVSRRL